jgi:hypothetical protein
MSDSASELSARTQSRRRQHLFANLLLIAWGVVAIGLILALRSHGSIGQIARGAALGVIVLAVATVPFLIMRSRRREREVEDRIDQMLTRRARPPVRFEDDR